MLFSLIVFCLGIDDAQMQAKAQKLAHSVIILDGHVDLPYRLIEEMEDKLSQTLMDKIKNEKLTDKEKAKWIYQKFLDAEKQGLELDFNELVKTAQGNIKRERKPRKTQNKNSQNQENKVSKATAIDAENINNIK